MSYKTKILKINHLIQSYLNKGKTKELVSKINHPVMKLVYETILQVKNDEFSDEDRAIFEKLKSIRETLANSDEEIDYSLFEIDKKEVVSNVLKRAASPENWCKFHYALAKNFNAQNYLEIGTNLGISGSYILSSLNQNTEYQFFTMEGLPDLCKIAKRNFAQISDENHFTLLQGLYNDTFPKMLELPIRFDVAFIDGNHKFEPTLFYFEQLKNKVNSPAIFVFDDIYISEEMQKVWKRIKIDSDINFTFDLYKLGVVVMDKKEKIKNLNLRYFLSR